jgi:hypothetical protein
LAVRPESPLPVKVCLKPIKIPPILKKGFLIESIMCARNVMQCAYRCTVFKLLNRSIISPGRG